MICWELERREMTGIHGKREVIIIWLGGNMEEEEEEELDLPSFGRVVARLCEVEDCCVRNRRTGPLNKSLFFSIAKMGMELGV